MKNGLKKGAYEEEENNLRGENKMCLCDREPSEIKKRGVIIIEDLKAASQVTFHWRNVCLIGWRVFCLSVWLGRGVGGWEGGLGGTSLSCQNRLEGHPHARGT